MLLTLKIKLLPSKEQYVSLSKTMKQFNLACSFISAHAFNTKTFGKIQLQKDCYYDVRRDFGLSAQMAVRAIGKVSESYRADKKTLHAFKETGAMVYDQRILSFSDLESASLLTLDGRIRVPMVLGTYHKEMVFGHRVRGQADLILQGGAFYLMLVVEAPEGTPAPDGDFLGVDLGIVNIAVDNHGETHSGSAVNAIRRRNSRIRARLQSKGTKSAKRLLKKRSGKERRYARDANHVISKKIVGKAKALKVGIALEDLKGIRENIEGTVPRRQRYRQSSWAFYQLRRFIEYKARIAGVTIALVDPRGTSRACPVCEHADKRNRVSRNDFCCQACGYAGPADNVAAMNIRSRAVCQSAERGSLPATCKPPHLCVG